MIPEKSITLFADQVEAAIKAGHEIHFVEAAQDGRDMLVCALDANDCVLGSAMVKRPGLPLEQLERIFGLVAATVICTRRILPAGE
jgi:hypothetical protein